MSDPRLLTQKILESNRTKLDSTIAAQNWPSHRIATSSDVYTSVAHKTKGRGLVHIVASGPSLLGSVHKIKAPFDAVFGFNFSALLPLNFDLYFCEIALPESPPSQAQEWLLKAHAATRIKSLWFKNLWEGKISRDYFLGTYSDSVRLVKDIYVPYNQKLLIQKPSYQAALADILYCADAIYLRQSLTTVYTLIGVALHAGFDSIVLHGFDLGGGHFYTDPDFHWPAKTPEHHYRYWHSYSTSQSAPYTSLLGLQRHFIWPVYQHLRQHNVSLFAGSEASPSAQLLPVYQS